MAAAVLNYVALLNDGQQHEKALLLLERLFSSTNHSLSDAPGSLSSLACASPVASVSGPALASTAPHGADQSWGEWWPAALEAAENHMLCPLSPVLYLACPHADQRNRVCMHARHTVHAYMHQYAPALPLAPLLNINPCVCVCMCVHVCARACSKVLRAVVQARPHDAEANIALARALKAQVLILRQIHSNETEGGDEQESEAHADGASATPFDPTPAQALAARTSPAATCLLPQLVFCRNLSSTPFVFACSCACLPWDLRGCPRRAGVFVLTRCAWAWVPGDCTVGVCVVLASVVLCWRLRCVGVCVLRCVGVCVVRVCTGQRRTRRQAARGHGNEGGDGGGNVARGAADTRGCGRALGLQCCRSRSLSRVSFSFSSSLSRFLLFLLFPLSPLSVPARPRRCSQMQRLWAVVNSTHAPGGRRAHGLTRAAASTLHVYLLSTLHVYLLTCPAALSLVELGEVNQVSGTLSIAQVAVASPFHPMLACSSLCAASPALRGHCGPASRAGLPCGRALPNG